VVLAMEEDTGIDLVALMINGGMTGNEFLVQLISDTLQCQLNRGNTPDVSALGAGLLAGLAIGLYKDLESIKQIRTNVKSFEPKYQPDVYYEEWLKYVKRIF